MFRKILLAYDGSAGSEAALQQAADLAAHVGAELHLLGVVPVPGIAAIGGVYGGGLFEVERERTEAAVQSAIRHLGDRVPVKTTIREGHAATQIAAVADEIGADLVVIGHGDKGVLARWFEGSTGAALIRELPCNLLVASGEG